MSKVDKLLQIVGDDKKYLQTLIENDQFEILNEVLNENVVHDLINQIKEFELIYTDGLNKYLERAKILLHKSKNNNNKYSKYIIQQPENVVKIKFNWKENVILKNNEQLLQLRITDDTNEQNTKENNDKKKNPNKKFNEKNDTLQYYNNENTISGGTTLSQPSLNVSGNVTTHCITPLGESVYSNNYKTGSIKNNLNSINEINNSINLNQISNNNKNFNNSENHIHDNIELNNKDNLDNKENNLSILKTFLYYEKIGLEAIDKVGLVLLAGGLGERLKYNDIKLKLLTNLISKQSYIEHYCNYLKCFQNYIKKKKNKEVDIPFILMLSEDTYDKTLNYFEEKNYFGLKKTQIHFLTQKKVFCVKDNDAHLDFKVQDGLLKISKKPHGHGDIHLLIRQSNILDSLIEKGYKYLYFFQDTNALAIRNLFVCLGVSIEKKLHMNFMGISRKIGEEIGVICKLVSAENTLSVNVEYNMLESLLNYTADKEVDVNGYSSYPGNSNVIIFEIEKYNQILKETNGIVPEFINPKYTDNTRNFFQSPTRIECMMQDFALYFTDKNDKVGVTELNRFLCFSPVKNDTINAQKKKSKNIHPECMFSGEIDLYYSNFALIELACLYNGKTIKSNEFPIKVYNGIEYFNPPKILIEPQFAFTLYDIINKIKGDITISNNSTLWIKSDAIINNLQLDGTLIIDNMENESKPIILENNCKIKNKGYRFVEIDENSNNISDHLKIRGYKLLKCEEFVISS